MNLNPRNFNEGARYETMLQKEFGASAEDAYLETVGLLEHLIPDWLEEDDIFGCSNIRELEALIKKRSREGATAAKKAKVDPPRSKKLPEKEISETVDLISKKISTMKKKKALDVKIGISGGGVSSQDVFDEIVSRLSSKFKNMTFEKREGVVRVSFL